MITSLWNLCGLLLNGLRHHNTSVYHSVTVSSSLLSLSWILLTLAAKGPTKPQFIILNENGTSASKYCWIKVSSWTESHCWSLNCWSVNFCAETCAFVFVFVSLLCVNAQNNTVNYARIKYKSNNNNNNNYKSALSTRSSWLQTIPRF